MRSRRRLSTMALLAATAIAAGCDARLDQLTSPPPGATVELDVDSHELSISRGAAVGIACSNASGLACAGLRASVEDRGIALARRAHQDDLVHDGAEGETSRAAFVVAGLAEGSTVVHLEWDDGSLDVAVTVTGR